MVGHAGGSGSRAALSIDDAVLLRTREESLWAGILVMWSVARSHG